MGGTRYVVAARRPASVRESAKPQVMKPSAVGARPRYTIQPVEPPWAEPIWRASCGANGVQASAPMTAQQKTVWIGVSRRRTTFWATTPAA